MWSLRNFVHSISLRKCRNKPLKVYRELKTTESGASAPTIKYAQIPTKKLKVFVTATLQIELAEASINEKTAHPCLSNSEAKGFTKTLKESRSVQSTQTQINAAL